MCERVNGICRFFKKLRGEIPNFDEIVCTNGTINVEGISLGIFIGSIKKYREIDIRSPREMPSRNGNQLFFMPDEFSIEIEK